MAYRIPVRHYICAGPCKKLEGEILMLKKVKIFTTAATLVISACIGAITVPAYASPKKEPPTVLSSELAASQYVVSSGSSSKYYYIGQNTYNTSDPDSCSVYGGVYLNIAGDESLVSTKTTYTRDAFTVDVNKQQGPERSFGKYLSLPEPQGSFSEENLAVTCYGREIKNAGILPEAYTLITVEIPEADYKGLGSSQTSAIVYYRFDYIGAENLKPEVYSCHLYHNKNKQPNVKMVSADKVDPSGGFDVNKDAESLLNLLEKGENGSLLKMSNGTVMADRSVWYIAIPAREVTCSRQADLLKTTGQAFLSAGSFEVSNGFLVHDNANAFISGEKTYSYNTPEFEITGMGYKIDTMPEIVPALSTLFGDYSYEGQVVKESDVLYPAWFAADSSIPAADATPVNLEVSTAGGVLAIDSDGNKTISKSVSGTQPEKTQPEKTQAGGNIEEHRPGGSQSKEEKPLDKSAPLVNGIKNGKIYKKAVTVTFRDSGSGVKEAKLNGKVIRSGKRITKNGKYTLKVMDRAGNAKTIKFTVDTEVPAVKGVKNGKVYKKAVTVMFADKVSGIKTAKLNGRTIKNRKKITKNGLYTLKISDRAGNLRTVKFKIRQR